MVWSSVQSATPPPHRCPARTAEWMPAFWHAEARRVGLAFSETAGLIHPEQKSALPAKSLAGIVCEASLTHGLRWDTYSWPGSVSCLWQLLTAQAPAWHALSPPWEAAASEEIWVLSQFCHFPAVQWKQVTSPCWASFHTYEVEAGLILIWVICC